MPQRDIIHVSVGGGGAGASDSGAETSLRVAISRPTDGGNADNVRRPLVVINRGVANSEADLDLLEAISTALGDTGVVAALIEPRTTNLILEDFHAFTLAEEISDLLAVVRQTASHADVDAARIGLVGWSLGAVAAIAVAGQLPSINRLCLLNPATTAFIIAKVAKPTASNGAQRETLPRAFVESLSAPAAVWPSASSGLAALIIHAAADRFIPPDISLDVLAGLGLPKRPVERVLVARADHVFSTAAARQACVRRIVGFFASKSVAAPTREVAGAMP